jgi:branched-chain amino acid transport system permease protein
MEQMIKPQNERSSKLPATLSTNYLFWGQILILALLLVAPLVIDSLSILNLLTKIFIMAVFAMSYDLLFGYTGIISFGHALFFGTGAYTVGMIMAKTGNSFSSLLAAIIGALAIAIIVSIIIGTLSLRVKGTVYFAMLTLAFGQLFYIIAQKWRSVTHGEDGFSFRIPAILLDRVNFYYLALAFMVIILLVLKQFLNSPTGKVLVAIRENEQRAMSLGYDVLHFKLIANVVAGVTASLAGIMFALYMRFVSTTVVHVDKTIEALLMTIVGGVGTLYGGIVGAGVVIGANYWLANLAKNYPILERWYIFFGLLYIVIVLFMPGGIIGTLRDKFFPSDN